MGLPLSSAQLFIIRHNNGGFQLSVNFEGKSESCAFKEPKEVGEYISSFCSKMPIVKSDVVELLDNQLMVFVKGE